MLSDAAMRRSSTAWQARLQATRFPLLLDQVAAADAVGAVIILGEGIRNTPHHLNLALHVP
jgi:hypothetical protein